ncbi:hypothetical protein HYDPIDRAFT_100389 [Hydnomerulius pinastri MD-312]|uniref:G-patch domain-containing protein n=1 Tax=Hydnomerulius pinastri MD-312 TaxID=994086 RepID=A0A0C9VPM7_9AGAM|nr:hypothetical protein HYDPIDRAFT_100389 [Hydnomerulius pinastri MD-312]
MSAPTSKVSFTVRRPTPISRPSSSGPESDRQFKVPALPRHLASAGSSGTGSPLAVFTNSSGQRASDGHHNDSSDGEDERAEDELVTGFDQFGVQRLIEKKKKTPEGPLVIPSLPNPDWREAARKRRAASRTQPYTSRSTPSFVPDSARAATGADGSVGGLGTRDAINSGPQLSGLQVKKQAKIEADEENVSIEETEIMTTFTDEVKMEVEESEDQKALRAILAGDDESSAAAAIDVIPVLSETDALKQDVEALPDVATADDYARVPISAFGIAMLRGMGWTEGTVASKSEKGKKSGLIEPYLPQARPALLGIGAKEREPDDDGSGKNKKKQRGQEKRYIPVVRRDSGRDESGGSRSGTVSRRASWSPTRRERGEHVQDRDRSRYDDRERRRDRDRDYEDKRKDRDYDGRGRDRDRGKGYSDRDMDTDGRRERDRANGYDDRERRKERRVESERDRTRLRDHRDDRDGDREGRSRRDRDRRD